MLKSYIPAVRYGNKVAIDEENHAVAVQNTNGTAAVNVFSGSGAATFPMAIADIIITSLDTTAGNITVENPVGTVVATIAKGTASGALVGAVTLSNTTVAAGSVLIVKSSTAGNAAVKIFFNNTASGV